MKTKLAALTVSLFVAIGLSGCYTQFATTSDNSGGYGSSSNSNSGYYNSSSDSGYSYYDSTAAPMVNNYNYNYYGYDYPYSNYNWNYNYFTPSPAWWYSDNLWFGFGWNSGYWDPYSMYGGYGWPYNYYSPYSSYYSPYYYSPFYPYAPIYVYQNGNTESTGRIRNIGSTRNGREGYGGGTSPVPYVQPSAGTSVGSANAGSGASRNVQPSPATRTRTNENPPSNGTVEPRTRTREYAPPPSQYPVPNSQSPAAPQNQPRVREGGSTRGGGGHANDSSNQGRSRSGVSYYRGGNVSSQVRYYWHPQPPQAERVRPVNTEPQRYYYHPQIQEVRHYAAPRYIENAPRMNNQPRFSMPSVRESAPPPPPPPAPARSESSSGNGRTRH